MNDLLSSLLRRRARPERVFANPEALRDGYDVIVVGGGVRGLAAARACAIEGAKVALLAAGEIAAAADERAWPVARAARRDRQKATSDVGAPARLRKLIRALNGPIETDQSGALTLASTYDEMERLGHAAERLKGDGVECWMVPALEVAALSPPFAAQSETGAGLYEPRAVTVDADGLALALAESAAAHGAHLFAHAPAESIEREGPAATGVRALGRLVNAGAIVLAGDLSAIRLVREGKGRLSLTRDEREIVSTMGGAPAIGPALAIDDLLISRDHAGALTISGPVGLEGLARRITALAPSLGGLPVAAQEPVTVWTGVDGLPQVGPAEIERLWLALGFGRDALSLCAGAAEHLAALMAGRRGARTFEHFAPTRRPAVRAPEPAR